MQKWFIILIATGFFTSCNDNNNDAAYPEAGDTTTATTSPVPKSESPDSLLIPLPVQDKPDQGQYCFIKKVYTRNNSTFIDADYIQFLMGDEAATAARKYGDAEMIINKNGDTTWATPDNTYILNENPQIRTLPLATDVEYYSIYMKGNPYLLRSDIDDLKARLSADDIYILTLNSNGVVTKIKQQYLP